MDAIWKVLCGIHIYDKPSFTTEQVLEDLFTISFRSAMKIREDTQLSEDRNEVVRRFYYQLIDELAQILGFATREYRKMFAELYDWKVYARAFS